MCTMQQLSIVRIQRAAVTDIVSTLLFAFLWFSHFRFTSHSASLCITHIERQSCFQSEALIFAWHPSYLQQGLKFSKTHGLTDLISVTECDIQRQPGEDWGYPTHKTLVQVSYVMHIIRNVSLTCMQLKGIFPWIQFNITSGKPSGPSR